MKKNVKKLLGRIILVGNGFDLAHNLPTSYKSFMYWYWKQRFINLCEDSYESSDKLCTLKIFGERERVWRDFKKENPNMSGKDFLDLIQSGRKSRKFELDASYFFENIIQSIEVKGWVDIEFEYYKMLKKYLPNESRKEAKSPKKLNDELHDIKMLLVEYLMMVQDDFDKINPEICEIINAPVSPYEISFTNSLNSEDVAGHRPDMIMFLNFNYTRIVDAYRDFLSKNGVRVCVNNHIHGDLSNPGSIIFGYGDELDSDFKSLLEINNNDFLEEIKSIRYLESPAYRRMLNFINMGPYQVYIMGHSCGISDRTLLNTLFEHPNCFSIKPFFYQLDNGTDNFSEIIQNIYRNFSDQKLFRDRVVNKEACIPLPQI